MRIRAIPLKEHSVSRPEPDDQASGLRRLLGDRPAFQPLGLIGPDDDLNASATAGLACALSQRGSRTCVIDELPAPGTVATQLGLTPRHSLDAAALGRHWLEDALIGLPEGPGLLRAERPMAGIAESDDQHWNRLGEEFSDAAWTWLLLAAPSDDRPSLALAAPWRLLVLPAAKSRLAEAYAVAKAAHRRQPDARWLALFMNAPDTARAESLMTALDETARRFLGLDIAYLGVIPKDDALDLATRAMQPLHQVAPSAPATLAFRQLADRLPTDPVDRRLDARSFWQRLGLFARHNRLPRYPEPKHVQHGRVFG